MTAEERPAPKLRYVAGGLHPPRPVRRSAVALRASRGRRARLRALLDAAASLALHGLAVALAVWLPVLLLGPAFDGARAAKEVQAQLAAPREPAPPAPLEPEREVVPLVLDEEPRPVEQPLRDPPTVDEAPAPLDWLPPADPFARLDAASWKRPLPAPPEEPEVELTDTAPPVPAVSEPAPEERTPLEEGTVEEPLALEHPAPAYPVRAQRLRQEGTVRLRLRVDAAGAVLGVEVAESSGYVALDDAALAACRRWVFRARHADEPLVRVFVKPFTFELER